MIWCVEDDASIRDIEVYALQSTGLEAKGFEDGSSFWEALGSEDKPELAVIDVMLPGISGIELLRRMKESPELCDIPVVMATAKDTEYDKITGLDLGADYYLTKPFGVMELVSCVKAVLRRCKPKAKERILKTGGLEVNLDEHTVTGDGQNIVLTYKEFELLKLFLSNPGTAFTRDRLLEEVWGTDYCGETREKYGDRTYQFDVSRIESDGAARGSVILFFDMTEQQNSEKIRREFTANVSHELKTPLQGIIGSAELIENGMVRDEDMPRFVGHIRSEAQRLVSLINDIIRLSQLDEGDEMPRENVGLLSLSQEISEDLGAAAKKKNVTLNVGGREAYVFGVPRLLYEIVYNLCDNAIKYNREGGRVDISVENENGSAVLTVSDTGIGIAPKHQARIFERFYRVDKSHSKATGGTGLGLSIVKHAVLCHGGTLSLESEENKGTRITVTLPLSK